MASFNHGTIWKGPNLVMSGVQGNYPDSAGQDRGTFHFLAGQTVPPVGDYTLEVDNGKRLPIRIEAPPLAQPPLNHPFRVLQPLG